MDRDGDSAHQPRLPEPLLSELSGWLAEQRRGRPARAIARALVSYAGGANLDELSAQVHAAGLALTDTQLGVELARALRWLAHRAPRFAALLAPARECLGEAVAAHLAQRIVDQRMLEVVMDHAFGVCPRISASRLGISVEEVRALRREASGRDGYELSPPPSAPPGPPSAA